MEYTTELNGWRTVDGRSRYFWQLNAKDAEVGPSVVKAKLVDLRKDMELAPSYYFLSFGRTLCITLGESQEALTALSRLYHEVDDAIKTLIEDEIIIFEEQKKESQRYKEIPANKASRRCTVADIVDTLKENGPLSTTDLLAMLDVADSYMGTLKSMLGNARNRQVVIQLDDDRWATNELKEA